MSSDSITYVPEYLEDIREIVADILEVETDEVGEKTHFAEELDADSLRAIEILSQLEKKFKIDIPQTELPRMENLSAVYAVVAERAGW